MNLNQMISRLIRTFGMRFLNQGMNKSIRRANSGTGGKQTAQQKASEKTMRDTVKRARQAARITRQFRR